MLQFTPDCTALNLTVESWLAVTLHMSLSGHAVDRWLAVIMQNSRQSRNISTRANLSRHKSSWTRSPVHGEIVARQIQTCRRFSLARNSPHTCLYVHFVWDLVAPSRFMWTHSKGGFIYCIKTPKFSTSSKLDKKSFCKDNRTNGIIGTARPLASRRRQKHVFTTYGSKVI